MKPLDKMKRLESMLLFLWLFSALGSTMAQSDYPTALSTLQADEYAVVKIPELDLIGAYFLRDAKNKLCCPLSHKVFDVETKEMMELSASKTGFAFSRMPSFLPAKSSDPRWADIQITT